jgi:hypothetical protein
MENVEVKLRLRGADRACLRVARLGGVAEMVLERERGAAFMVPGARARRGRSR